MCIFDIFGPLASAAVFTSFADRVRQFVTGGWRYWCLKKKKKIPHDANGIFPFGNFGTYITLDDREELSREQTCLNVHCGGTTQLRVNKV